MPPILPASTKGGGTCFGFPDACLTQVGPVVVPIPYPNTGMVNQAKKTSSKVKICGKDAVTKKSEMSRSMGDEAGSNKGVMSGTNMGKVTYKKCSSKVKCEGQATAHLTSITGHNGSNANMPAGAQVAPSQTKVLISV